MTTINIDELNTLVRAAQGTIWKAIGVTIHWIPAGAFGPDTPGCHQYERTGLSGDLEKDNITQFNSIEIPIPDWYQSHDEQKIRISLPEMKLDFCSSFGPQDCTFEKALNLIRRYAQ